MRVDSSDLDQEAFEGAAAVLASAERLVVLTGAGISTDSGIPDFRGPSGVWTKNPAAEKASHISHYLGDPEVRRAAWQHRLHAPVWHAEPSTGHRCVFEFERQGRLHALVTQNIDGLHQAAGHHPSKVIEVHGTVHFSRCWDCDDRQPMADVLDRVRNGDPDPACERCRGILKSDTISFGQALVPEVIERAFEAARSCDVLFAIGSTLSVGPVNGCVPIARREGAQVVILNGEPTEMDRYANHRIIGQIADVLPHLT